MHIFYLYQIQILYEPFIMLTEDLVDRPSCQFCFSTFNSRDEWKSHTFSHFTPKTCFDCNVQLIQICDDWFELHTCQNNIIRCQNNIHIHTPPVNQIENNCQWVEKLEATEQELEAVKAEHMLGGENDAELKTFDENNTTDFSAANEDDGWDRNSSCERQV